MIQRFNRAARLDDPLDGDADAVLSRFTDVLNQAYTLETPPTPASVDAAIIQAVRARYAPRSGGRVTPSPARDRFRHRSAGG